MLTVEAWAGNRVITDQLGRDVSLPDEPVRVISLAPSITEIVFALERHRALAGVTIFSDFPEAARSLPKVGSYVHLDLERIIALRPDLCIAIKDGNPVEIINRIESMGIPVFAVNPRNLETVMETISHLGKVLNAEKKAQTLTANMRYRKQRVTTLVKKAGHRPRIFFQIGISPIVSVGSDTFIHELIVLAGGKNLAAGPVPYPRFSREQVLNLAPDVIIITSMARKAVFEQVKAEWQKWPNLPAARNGRIYLEDSDILHRPTPRLVEGLEKLFKMLHPELSEAIH
jgi:iron complex transport system substrate-binding protein